MDIAIVDDLDTERMLLSEVLKIYGRKNGIKTVIKGFPSGEEFLEKYEPFSYGIIFMDIYMDGMSGIETAKKIRLVDKDILIIFLTTSNEHALEAFDVRAYHYIQKTQDKNALMEMIFQVLDEIFEEERNASKLSFSYEYVNYCLPFSEIICIVSNGHNVEITDCHGDVYRPRSNFSDILKRVQMDKRFLLINRGVLVNMDYVIRFEESSCFLNQEVCLPVNQRKIVKLEHIRQHYIFNKIRNKKNHEIK